MLRADREGVVLDSERATRVGSLLRRAVAVAALTLLTWEFGLTVTHLDAEGPELFGLALFLGAMFLWSIAPFLLYAQRVHTLGASIVGGVLLIAITAPYHVYAFNSSDDLRGMAIPIAAFWALLAVLVTVATERVWARKRGVPDAPQLPPMPRSRRGLVRQGFAAGTLLAAVLVMVASWPAYGAGALAVGVLAAAPIAIYLRTLRTIGGVVIGGYGMLSVASAIALAEATSPDGRGLTIVGELAIEAGFVLVAWALEAWFRRTSPRAPSEGLREPA